MWYKKEMCPESSCECFCSVTGRRHTGHQAEINIYINRHSGSVDNLMLQQSIITFNSILLILVKKVNSSLVLGLVKTQSEFVVP